jgi:uncharacterized membrane protein YdjX (TVP38/TMEM64 family)
MNVLSAVLRELLGLFVDDSAFAAEIALVVVLAVASAALMPNLPLATGAILLFGCLGVLLASVARAARRR